jgi:ribosomal-protein-alanine N-acetyltransferase
MRHKGIARALVMQALEVGLAQAAMRAVLELRASNHAAHALYQGLGFRDVTTRPTYYTNPIEDALLMELDPIVSESGRLRQESVEREGVLARIIHEGSSRKRADAKRDGHSEA